MTDRIRIFGYIDKGYFGHSVMVECSIRNGFPGFDITGLPGASVKEARERVRCALRSCDFKFPQSRILVNLSPASQSKDSTLLDLPLACSILCAMNRQKEAFCPDPVSIMIAGELTLDGNVLQSPQTVGALEAAANAGCRVCMIPVSIPEAERRRILEEKGITVIRALNLTQVYGICCDLICGTAQLMEMTSDPVRRKSVVFEDIIGLDEEKKTLAMAAGGFHSTLLFGPPGVGKTMLCSRMHLLLPDYTDHERDEVTRILGCAELNDIALRPEMRERMRILSHDCTQTQFVSGSSAKSPGEGALAHMGTLVLDELNKFTPKLLETVKDTYDKGYTQSTRSGEVLTYPARFLLVANMNACSCGALGDPESVCTCTAQKLTSHWSRIGRQLLERFDIRLPVSPQKDMLSLISGPHKDDAYYIDKVSLAVDRQRERYRYIENVEYNGQIHYSTSALLKLNPEISLFNRMESREILSSRSQIGIIALARTIADYDDRADVREEDFLRAAELRRYGLGDYYWRSLK